MTSLVAFGKLLTTVLNDVILLAVIQPVDNLKERHLSQNWNFSFRKLGKLISDSALIKCFYVECLVCLRFSFVGKTNQTFAIIIYLALQSIYTHLYRGGLEKTRLLSRCLVQMLPWNFKIKLLCYQLCCRNIDNFIVTLNIAECYTFIQTSWWGDRKVESWSCENE